MNDVQTSVDLPIGHGIEQKLYTVADLASLPSDLPSGTVRYELHHGRLITMTPPAFYHGKRQLRMGMELCLQGEKEGHGVASGEAGVILGRNPDHVFGPDAVFIANDRLPLKFSTEGYLETIPHLIVEVRSPNETQASLRRKAEDYLKAGAVVVWVVDPIQRNVVEYRKDIEPHIYTEADTLTIEDIIPGFSLPVSVALQE